MTSSALKREWVGDHADTLEEAVKRRTADLVRSNEYLRNELFESKTRCADLARQLQASTMGSHIDRESRRAALNLMEDAIRAGEAERLENAERRRVERKLLEADRRKDEFLATLAHELRNPLAPIRNSLQLLRMGKVDSAASIRLHNMLERQVNHMVRLVDDLMEVSRITRGKIELKKVFVSLTELLSHAVEAAGPHIRTGRHELDVKSPAEDITLQVDPVRMVQVITNLLNNAAKYTPDGGRITLSARLDEGTVAIAVRDTGMGIPPEMLPKVFDLFTQIDRTLGRAQGGLGIGLTLVKSLVSAHGGTIEAKSDGEDCGSEFTVRLPFHADEKDCSSARLAPEPKFISQRILLIDDNQDAAEMLAELLKSLGAEVMAVNSGPAALKSAPAFRPDVVLLDIGMPEMDGYETARRLQGLDLQSDYTLIAVTGWGQASDRQKSAAAGFDFHLVKPVDLEELRKVLGTLEASPTR